MTPGLLAAYCRPGFRREAGEGARLHAVTVAGRTRFAVDELDRFDAELGRPWVAAGEPRPAVPDAIVAHLRAESRNQCSRCGEGVGLETAHIEPWARCLSHHHHNLIRLCTACHAAHDVGGVVTTAELRGLKDRQVAATREQLATRNDPDYGRSPPPRPTRAFHGRASEVDELVAALRSGGSVLVTGTGGIGKTELLLQALECAATGREVVWLDVERLRDAEGVMAALRRYLSADGEPCGREDIPAKLDRVSPCLVFDGLERGGAGALEALEDTIAGLHATTRSTQFVSTSQAASHRLPADLAITLGPLDPEASGRLLSESARGRASAAEDGVVELLKLCAGHALTLRIAGALASHYGSATAAVRRIMLHGGEVIALPAREGQDAGTSLSVCLGLAYEALTRSERMVLWLIANAPGGLYAGQFERDFYNIGDGEVALAGLRRWHLAYGSSTAELERVHLLSPVRLFAVARFQRDEPEEAERLLRELLNSIGVMIAVIELRSSNLEDVDYMLFRYEQEMPNIRRLIEEAAARLDDGDLLDLALSASSALVRYFFVLQLGEDGAAMMSHAAGLALSAGKVRRAAALTLQAVAMGGRVPGGRGRVGSELLDRVEAAAGDSQISADLACARAIVALDSGDPATALARADEALARLREVAAEIKAEEAPAEDGDRADADARRGDFDDDVASALRVKGDALLALGRYEEAAARYRHALRHVRGSAVAVNAGQLLHQIGNCEGALGNHEVAARHYVQAARIFATVGMHEFLGKAMGELGYALLDWDGTDVAGLDSELLTAALADLERDMGHAFRADPFDPAACVGVVRRVYGAIVAGVFIADARDVGDWAFRVATEVLAAGPLHCGVADPEDEIVPLITLDVALRLAFVVADLEESRDENGDPDEGIVRALLALCCGTPPHARAMFRLTDFLAAYLTRRLGVTNATPNRLREFAANGDAGVHDELELDRPRR